MDRQEAYDLDFAKQVRRPRSEAARRPRSEGTRRPHSEPERLAPCMNSAPNRGKDIDAEISNGNTAMRRRSIEGNSGEAGSAKRIISPDERRGFGRNQIEVKDWRPHSRVSDEFDDDFPPERKVEANAEPRLQRVFKRREGGCSVQNKPPLKEKSFAEIADRKSNTGEKARPSVGWEKRRDLLDSEEGLSRNKVGLQQRSSRQDGKFGTPVNARGSIEDFDHEDMERSPEEGGPRSNTKLKVKFGGVTRTLLSSSPTDKGGKGLQNQHDGKKDVHVEQPPARRRHRLILQGDSDDDEIAVPKIEQPRIQEPMIFEEEKELSTGGPMDVLNAKADKKTMDVSARSARANLSLELSKTKVEIKASSVSPVQTASTGQAIRKSSRVIKRRVFDDDLDGDDHDDIEEVKKSRKRRKSDDQSSFEIDESPPKEDFIIAQDDDEVSSEDEQATQKGKKSSMQDLQNIKEKTGLTIRQRAMLSSKEGDTEANTNLIEFPDGLVQRRRKGRLTEEEKLAKKEEAARKRRQQVEKAAKEIQASAIQKILNQDSTRKKREVKLKKQKEELAQGKLVADMEAASNSVRWIFGPSGTTVSWASGVQLPEIFTSAPPSYPPPREKCAVSTCNNAYKYRHPKLNLPLCSLQCYKAIQPLQVS